MKISARIASIALALAVAVGLAGPITVHGQDAATASPTVVPPLIKYSGVMGASGTQNRISSAALARLVTATFSLYELQEGGAPLWSETQKVQLDEQGRYVVLLGATSSAGIPLDLFTSGRALWLGVQPQVSAAGELPRVLLVAVPYALKAADSDTLGGKPASAYALAGSPTVVPIVAAGVSLPPSAVNANQSGTRSAPASSPETSQQGAVVTALRVCGHDFDTDVFTGTLMMAALTSSGSHPTAVSMATISSSPDIDQTLCYQTTSITNATIDNTANQYYVQVVLPDNEVEFSTVQIDY